MGVLVGGAMVTSPQRIWWFTESWKFKNPEANEPSWHGFVGWSIIHSEFERKNRREAEQQRKAAEAAFVVPRPENRGQLPVIGYSTDKFPKGIEITVYYLAPGESVRAAVRDSARHGAFKSNFPCYTFAARGHAKDAPLLVNPELFWAPEKLGDMAKSERCHPGVGHKVHETSRSVDGSVPPPVVTDSAIVDRYGTEILPAASGNVVPKLPERMYPDP
ncbi:hypothetical protein A5734_04355 [Mycolicibacterium fortuitum]|nr:hypothetical protein A5734_04355 [Mycolicibacterium fortuitum]